MDNRHTLICSLLGLFETQCDAESVVKSYLIKYSRISMNYYAGKLSGISLRHNIPAVVFHVTI